MSSEEPSYDQTTINAWTILSVLVAAAVFICFACGSTFLATGHWIWDLIRWIFSPII